MFGAYAEEEINGKIRYWVDSWQELIDNFNVNCTLAAFITAPPHSRNRGRD